MAKPTSNSLRALWAVTEEKISKYIKNSIVQNNGIFSEIEKSGGLKEVEDGGRDFNEPAIVGDSANCGGARRGQVLLIDEVDGIDAFEYSPAIFYGTVKMLLTDLAMNAGSARAVSLLKAKIEQLKQSVQNKLDIYLCGTNLAAAGGNTADDTGSQQGWLGLQDLVPDVAAQDIPGTGVSKAQYTKARSQVVTTACASAAAFNTANAGRTIFQSLFNSVNFDGEMANIFKTTQSIWNAFQISLQANEQFVNAGGTDQSVGYPALRYMAKTRVTWGDNILAGHVYALNTNFMKFKVLTDANFKMGDFIEAADQFSEVAKMLIMGQFMVNGPKFQGVATNFAF